jgi:hypothetical protein
VAVLATAFCLLASCSHPPRTARATVLKRSDFPTGYAQTAATAIDLADEAPARLASALRSATPWSAFSVEFEALPPAARTTVRALSVLSGGTEGARELFAVRDQLAAAVGFGGALPPSETPATIGEQASRLSMESPNGGQEVVVVWRSGRRVGLVSVVGANGGDPGGLVMRLAQAQERRFESG